MYPNTENIDTENWLEILLAETEREVKDDLEWSIILLQSKARKRVWELCATLGITHRSIPGTSCRLMEKYLAIFFKRHVPQTVTQGAEFKMSMLKRFCLEMACCILLASKMNSVSEVLPLARVRAGLIKLGFRYDQDKIKKAEYHVYKTIGFSIPVWSTIDTSEFLATLIGVKDQNIINLIGALTDVGEYYRPKIDIKTTKWYDQNDGASTSSASSGRCSVTKPIKVRDIHLCAGAVLAGVRYLPDFQVKTARRLATLTKTSATYLKAVGAAIYLYYLKRSRYLESRNKNDD